MNKYLWLIFALGWAAPAWPVDLIPEPTSQAILEYKAFSGTDNPDPGNHVVWKLYIYRAITQTAHSDGATEYLIAGLTPFPKEGYYVRLKINELYDYFQPIPRRGDAQLWGEPPPKRGQPEAASHGFGRSGQPAP
jgi:hypothetical protein